MRAGALNWGMFFQLHPDTSGKLAAFAYAFEHLEIAGYEELKRVARKVGDEETIHMAEIILGSERAAAQKLYGAFDRAVDASLHEVGVAENRALKRSHHEVGSARIFSLGAGSWYSVSSDRSATST